MKFFRTKGTQKNIRQVGVCTMIGLFLFVNVLGLFVVAHPASAQISVPITDAATTKLVIGQSMQAAKETVKETKLSFKNALLQSFLSSLVQGASYFTRKIAYDSAKWIANGGKGQSALAFEKGFGNYLATTVGDAGTTALEEFGQGFGLSLCSLPNVNLQLYLQLSIPNLYPGDSYGPSTSCTVDQLKNNWGEEGRRRWTQETGDQLAENFSRSLQVNTNSSDFGIALGAIGNIDRIRAGVREANIFDRLEGDGFKPVTDLISGNILTPGQTVKYEAESVTRKDQGQLQADQISGIYSAQALSIIPMAGSVFLNTLVSEGLTNLLSKKGLIPQPTPGQGTSEDGAPGRVTNRELEKAVSFFLKATTPRTNLEEIDIVAQMAACPENPGLNHCVMDNGLSRALSQENLGQERMTIASAMQAGLMNRDWLLIPPSSGLNDDLDCFDGHYCYSNIQKMRKLRIVPLGFEIAALRSDPDRPWTLGQVVENFENCGQRNPDGSINVDEVENYPFCHLIDPNWVLREPVSRCEAQVFGPELADKNGNIRREECVDISTCVSFDENGKCEQFGYCTREQNVWEIPGEQCDEQFATCETFINTQNKKAVSFLTRTLDADECTSDSVGCRAYSTEKINGEWVSVSTVRNNSNEVIQYKQYGRNRTLFFDKDIISHTCPANQAGCSAFFLLNQTSSTARIYDFVRTDGRKVTLNLKKAPEYLGCYDTNRATSSPEINWPQDKNQLALLPTDPACADYASVCLPTEVGCDGYTPVDGNDTVQIPAIIGQNACSAQCVGYGAYRQLASTFEGAKDPLYFIPKDADSCSLADVGCSEFTNLDELARGGESRAYFTDTAYCEKPIGANRSNEKVFYTWEGSVQSGYVIKTHRLKKVSASDKSVLDTIITSTTIRDAFANTSSPAVPQLSATEIETHYTSCNKAGYRDLINGGSNPADADCREFIDEEGNRFYRLMSEVVRVSDQCSPYRISQPSLVVDTSITGPTAADVCGYAKGLWNGSSCERCMGGGAYTNASSTSAGACVYNILASESNSCAASANQCRSYTGNFAGNVRTVSFFDFEPQGNTTTRGTWTSGNVAAEAVQVGGHSLQIDANTAEFEIAPGLVNTDAGRNIVHTISFWARGQSQSVRVEFYQGTSQVGSFSATPVSIGNSWRRYDLGPISFSGNEKVTTTVRFTRTGSGSGAYFVDNLRLSRVEDTYAFIKDSWKTAEGYNAPLVCDSNPVDAFPGEQLGCTAYTQESNDATVYATGFQNLCREQAIGCRALVDTHNTEAETAMLYNLRCTITTDVGGVSTVYQVPFGGNPQECTQWKDLTGESCMVEPGQSSCLIKSAPFTSANSSSIFNRLRFSDQFAVVVPADTPTTTPIFLSTHKKYQCDGEKYLGCQNVGLETEALPGDDQSTFVTTTIVNLPHIYNETLCTHNEIGCSEYSTNSGLSYFKDPTLIGSLSCQYTKGDGIAQRAGWYLDGIGRCGLPTADDLTISTSTTLPYCRVDSDCAPIGGVSTTCHAVNKTACYPNYLVNDGEYGLFSNQSGSDYKGFVGMCPAAQNGCVELIDRADTNPLYNGEGRPYYTILDETAVESAAECAGKASLREGCVLFDKTSDPSRLYNTAETYAKSEKTVTLLGENVGVERPSLVVPDTTGVRDSNTILKVGRNRECSEWLACRGATDPFIDNDGRKEYRCYDYDVCNKANGDTCGNFVTNTSTDQFLDQVTYVARDTSWYGHDYSGFSIFEMYPVADFRSVFFDSITPNSPMYVEAMKEPFLLYGMPNELFRGTNSQKSCTDSLGNPKIDWSVCGIDDGGRCFSGSCLYPVSGSFPDVTVFNSSTAKNYEKFISYVTANSCKAFPEESGPFPDTVLIPNSTYNQSFTEGAGGSMVTRKVFNGLQENFNKVSVCQDGNCVCDYNKVVYENGTEDYFSATSQNVQKIAGYCASGDRTLIGAPCDPTSSESDVCGGSATVPGLCVPVEKIERRLGTLGYCLEEDLSRPINGLYANGINAPKYACLTWLPLGISASRIDSAQQDAGAGYDSNQDGGGYGQVYCTQSTDVGTGEYDSEFWDSRYSLSTDVADFSNFNLCDVSTPAGRNYCTVDGTIDSPVPISFDDMFQVDGRPLIGAGNNNHYASGRMQCSNLSDFDGGRFVKIICQSGTTPTFLPNPYTLLSLWSWNYMRNIPVPVGDTTQLAGTNNKVLRIETDYSSNSTWGQVGLGGKTQIFSLLPAVVGESGVLFHPPRVWSGSKPSAYVTQGSNRWYTDMLAPGASNMSGSYLNASSVFEETLFDAAVKKITFVPLRMPVGDYGVNPAIGIRDFAIDIDRLSEKKRNGQEPSLLVLDVKQQKDGQDAQGCERGLRTDLSDLDEYKSEDGQAPSVGCGADDSATNRMNWEFGSETTDDGAVWSYMIERDADVADCHGLYSYCSYGDSGYSVSGGVTTDVRSEVAKRYVTVYFSDTVAYAPSFLSSVIGRGVADATPPQNSSEDPFSVACVDGKNWMAIGMDFNADGEFLGYISRMCHGASGGNGVQLAVIATEYDMCTNFAVVDNPLSVDQRNKAWTNRVWEKASSLLHPTTPNAGIYPDTIQKDFVNKPFASLLVTAQNILGRTMSSVITNSVFYDNQRGIPRSCTNMVGAASLFPYLSCWGLDNSAGYVASALGVLGAKDIDEAKGTLYDLFVLTFANSRFENNGNFNSDVVDDDSDKSDASGYVAGFEKPQIYSLNPSTCNNDQSDKTCTVAERGTLTVNGYNATTYDYNGDGFSDEDTSGVAGVVDGNGLIGVGTYQATVKFFGFADKNHMPIRRAMVRWDDSVGGTSPQSIGFQKNKKPYCFGDDEPAHKECTSIGGLPNYPPTQVTCQQDSDCSTLDKYKCTEVPKSFGNSSRACQEGYFEFPHTYSCDSGDQVLNGIAVSGVASINMDMYNRLRSGYGLGDSTIVCVYKPAAQILDNWGWCNASDFTRGANGSVIGSTLDKNAGEYSGDFDVDVPIGKGGCDPSEDKAWSYFKGTIIVVPEDALPGNR